MGLYGDKKKEIGSYYMQGLGKPNASGAEVDECREAGVANSHMMDC